MRKEGGGGQSPPHHSRAHHAGQHAMRGHERQRKAQNVHSFISILHLWRMRLAHGIDTNKQRA